MADNQTFYEFDEGDQAIQESDRAKSLAFRKQKQAARRQKLAESSKGAQLTGRSAQTAGLGVQAGAKAMKYGARGTEALGRGINKSGQSITRAGARLSETGLGAVVGVPLGAIGAGVSGAGLATEATGRGMAQAGALADRSGRNLRQLGSEISSTGKSDPTQDQSNNQSSRPVSFKAAKHGAKPWRDRLRRAVKEPEHSGLASQAFRLGTDNLLRQSWINLFSSWGLTLIWIHCHILLRFVIGTDYFCKLGHEWASWKPGNSLSGAMAEGEAMKAMVDQAGDRIGLLELMAVVLIDFLLFVIIISILVWLGVIGYIYIYPLEAASLIGEIVWSFAKSLGLSIVNFVGAN